MKEILKIENVSKTFTSKGRKKLALDKLSLSLGQGEILGVVGESGSGKSTLLRLISKQTPIDKGEISFLNKDIYQYGKEIYKDMQMVFQDPRGSFDPKFTIGHSFREIRENLGIKSGLTICELLKNVGLKEEYHVRCPKDLSGGECQRAAVAKAFSVIPKLILCDEITSALDVSAQAKIIDLLVHLVEEHGVSVVFVSHNLSLVSTFCHRVAILQNGILVEEGPTQEVLESPNHAYSKSLLAAQLVI